MHQTPSAPPTIADQMLGLLIMTGFMMVVVVVPLGVAFVFNDYKLHQDWLWARILGAVVAIATAIVGGLFLGIGTLVVKHRWRRQRNR